MSINYWYLIFMRDYLPVILQNMKTLKLLGHCKNAA